MGDTVGTTSGISPRDEDELSQKASGLMQYMANGIQTFVTKASRFWSGALTNYPEKFGSFTDKMTRALQNHTKYLVKLCRKALAWRPSEGLTPQPVCTVCLPCLLDGVEDYW